VPARASESPQAIDGATISVVIPVRNERGALPRALDCTLRPRVERVVVDGGSSDGSPRLAAELGAERILACEPGRAQQLSTGLEAASGDLVLFLHADTRLEGGWDASLRRALGDPAIGGGAFRLAFDSPRPAYRVLEAGVALRCRLLRLPYGDQGLFARRKPLLEAGGIQRAPIFEDLDLVACIRSLGRLALLPERAWTSPRRYERDGVLRTVLRNNLALAAYLLGRDRERVADWYRGKVHG
jgi:rSAM/selenodomain-associated transferase 2